MVKYWDAEKPEPGDKIVIVCDDGCSSSVAFVTDDEVLDGEDAWSLTDDFTRGSIWFKLPDDYPIAFMELTTDS